VSGGDTRGEVTTRESCHGFDTSLDLNCHALDCNVFSRSIGNVCTYLGACVTDWSVRHNYRQMLVGSKILQRRNRYEI
jgi:hypothetical protein